MTPGGCGLRELLRGLGGVRTRRRHVLGSSLNWALERASPSELNAVLGSPKELQEVLGRLVHVDVPSSSRAASVLAEKRVDELSVGSRASLVAMLDSLPFLDSRPAVSSVLLATHGTDLTRLKNILCAPLLADRTLRMVPRLSPEVRKHIFQAAAEAREACGGPVGVKTLFDIDDTLLCRLNDSRFPSGTVYPGVQSFVAALQTSSVATGASQFLSECEPLAHHRLADGWEGEDHHLAAQAPDAQLILLTGRPALGGFLAARTRKELFASGLSGAALLSGSVRTGLSSRRIADIKWRNFGNYASFFPEYCFTFVGDTGQGDAALALRMQRGNSDVVGLFLHDVTDRERTGCGGLKRDYAAAGISLFRTYAGAAVEAHRNGLLPPSALLRVCVAAKSELAQVDWSRRRPALGWARSPLRSRLARGKPRSKDAEAQLEADLEEALMHLPNTARQEMSF